MLLRRRVNRRSACGGQPHQQSGKREVWSDRPGPGDPGADVESLSAGRTGSSAAQDTTASENLHVGHLTPSLTHRKHGGKEPANGLPRGLTRGGSRDNVPVTMARDDPGRRAGSHGGASLAPRRLARGQPDRLLPDPSASKGLTRADATHHPHRGRPSRRAPRRPR